MPKKPSKGAGKPAWLACFRGVCAARVLIDALVKAAVTAATVISSITDIVKAVAKIVPV